MENWVGNKRISVGLITVIIAILLLTIFSVVYYSSPLLLSVLLLAVPLLILLIYLFLLKVDIDEENITFKIGFLVKTINLSNISYLEKRESYYKVYDKYYQLLFTTRLLSRKWQDLLLEKIINPEIITYGKFDFKAAKELFLGTKICGICGKTKCEHDADKYFVRSKSISIRKNAFGLWLGEALSIYIGITV